MLSETEKNGCKEILSKLPYQELVALAETVTKKQVKITGQREAVKAILLYSDSALELFSRKKMKREILFQYLMSKSIPVSSTIDKGGIIRTILNSWEINIDEGQFKVKLENEPQPAQTLGSRAGHSVSPSSSTSTQTGARPQPSNTSTQTSSRSQQSTSNTAFTAQTNSNNIGGAQADLNRHTVANTSNNRHVNAHSSQISQLQSSGNQVVNPGANMNQVNNTSAKPEETSRVGLTNNIHQTVVDKSELQVLGETFSKWFYENLNSHNPTLSKPQMDFGPNHFWDDAFFMLCSHSPATSEERFEGPLLVSQRFLSFAQEEQLLFNPNITSEGVYVKSDPYGMVMILVCGTIHRANDCLGVFQQMFGLVKDPRFENNYKIKKTKLDVRTDKPTVMPKLEANPESQMAALVPV